MELVTEETLDPKLHAQFLKAQSAIELLNYDYAISLLHNVLKDEPGFQKGRELLRGTQGARARGQKKKGLSLGSGLMKVKNKIKKDPLGAIEDIESKLDTDPYNVDANTLLYDAFMALGMPDMATFGLETIKDGHPDNCKNLHKLGDHHLVQGDATAAALVYELIAEQDPSDGSARKKAKDASAQATMTKTGIGQAGVGLKQLMKDSGEAEALEAASRIGATKEQMEVRLAELGQEYAADPQSLSVVKQIANLYQRLEDWENCASYYDYAYTLSNADTTLQRKAEDARDQIRGKEISILRAEVEAGGDDVDEKRARLEELEASGLVTQIAEARDRVEANPTDPQLRFDLGSHLFTAKEYREAIPHLQKAKNNPHIRIRAMLMLGRCYDAMNMDDLAVTTLVEANGELFAMDNTKKEMLYTLGVIHAKVGDQPKSLEAFKEIYNVDYGYRDVADRVEGSYSEGDDD